MSDTAPRLDNWQRHLIEEAAKRSAIAEARRSSLTGSTLWRVNGGRWINAGPAMRKLEILIYGRANPLDRPAIVPGFFVRK